MEIITEIKSLETQANGLGISIDAVCKKANIARSTFQRWKSGKHSPQLGVFNKFQKALNHLSVEDNNGGSL